MSSVLDRSSLEESPLADLHVLANELSIDGFRRMRKADLIDAMLAKQGVEEPASAGSESDSDGDDDGDRKPRARRSRSRRPARDADDGSTDDAISAADDAHDAEESGDSEDRGSRRGRRSRGGRGRGRDDSEDRGGRDREDRGGRDREDRGPRDEDRSVEGTVELLANGSGFVRVNAPETSDDDVYISAAQVKRCELVSGDKITGPVRSPRRSERFASLIRVDTINGTSADEVSEGTRFEDLKVAFPSERIELGSEDPTLQAAEWLTPFGKGSRVAIVGGARAGKSELLKKIAGALAGREGLEVSVVLAGARPEEVGEWESPVAVSGLGSSPDAQASAVEQAIEQGRRVAARGGDAVVLIDSLEHVTPQAGRRALAAARNIVDGGSLTVVAAAPAPLGGETTVIALDATLTALGRFPSLDVAASGTLRPELLVGDEGAAAIAKARTETSGL